MMLQKSIKIMNGNWQKGYEIKDPMYIINLRNKIGEGSAVCKLSDNIYDPVRQYLLE